MRNLTIKLWKAGIEAVQPGNIVPKCLSLKGNMLQVGGKRYTLQNNVYVVGMGKASLGMMEPLHKLLGSHIQRAILSVPVGSKVSEYSLGPTTEVYEGAANNLPDEAAMRTALKIEKLCQNLFSGDILIVLVSGGGSALAPYPVPPLTLCEKRGIVDKLMKAGATIHEINMVRRCLSKLKGGRLAVLSHPARVIGLLLSDVDGFEIADIGSGPTVVGRSSQASPVQAVEILRKYNLWNSASQSLHVVLAENESLSTPMVDVENVVVGNNRIAVQAVKQMAQEMGLVPRITITDVKGEASEVGKLMWKAVHLLVDDYVNQKRLYRDCGALFGISEADLRTLSKTLMHENKTICLLFGGETTVTVRGTGKGGRNQELVLAFALAAKEDPIPPHRPQIDFLFLSGGTDGIDGPTDAAGAVTYPGQIAKAETLGLSAREMLQNNDSYSFFKALDDLLITGHTGTNVMDVQVLLIKRRT